MNNLPLLKLFNKLRDAGLSLGIGEYQAMIQALQVGFGTSSRADLARLCCTIWVKSSEEKSIFNYYFNQIIPQEITIEEFNSDNSPSVNYLQKSDKTTQEIIRPTILSHLRKYFSLAKEYLNIKRALLLTGAWSLAAAFSYILIGQIVQPLPCTQVEETSQQVCPNKPIIKRSATHVIFFVNSVIVVCFIISIISPAFSSLRQKTNSKGDAIRRSSIVVYIGFLSGTLTVLLFYSLIGRLVQSLTHVTSEWSPSIQNPQTNSQEPQTNSQEPQTNSQELQSQKDTDINTTISDLTLLTIILILLILFYILFLFTLNRIDRWRKYKNKYKYNTLQKIIPPTSKNNPLPVSLLSEMIREIKDEIQIAKAIRQFSSDNKSTFNSITSYLPVTQRQMKQSWRYLRCLVREGAATELDIKATIDQIGRKGVLLNPVLVPRRLNRIQVLLLIDHGGSMLPFHKLGQRLVETAVQGGHLGKTSVYYFHNYPLDYLYKDTTRLEAETIEIILTQLYQSQTVAVIFSDAGATRGGLNTDRYKLTSKFIKLLNQTVRYVTWLNPMPKIRWLDTTAEEIAKIIPMFEASRLGLDSAIDVLRGRHSFLKESAR